MALLDALLVDPRVRSRCKDGHRRARMGALLSREGMQSGSCKPTARRHADRNSWGEELAARPTRIMEEPIPIIANDTHETNGHGATSEFAYANRPRATAARALLTATCGFPEARAAGGSSAPSCPSQQSRYPAGRSDSRERPRAALPTRALRFVAKHASRASASGACPWAWPGAEPVRGDLCFPSITASGGRRRDGSLCAIAGASPTPWQ
jgi:hypothetical protein